MREISRSSVCRASASREDRELLRRIRAVVWRPNVISAPLEHGLGQPAFIFRDYARGRTGHTAASDLAQIASQSWLVTRLRSRLGLALPRRRTRGGAARASAGPGGAHQLRHRSLERGRGRAGSLAPSRGRRGRLARRQRCARAGGSFSTSPGGAGPRNCRAGGASGFEGVLRWGFRPFRFRRSAFSPWCATLAWSGPAPALATRRAGPLFDQETSRNGTTLATAGAADEQPFARDLVGVMADESAIGALDHFDARCRRWPQRLDPRGAVCFLGARRAEYVWGQGLHVAFLFA